MEDVGYMNILSGYPRSVFQDFESYLRTEIHLVEDDIKMVLNKYNSRFITYELDPGTYSFRDLSETLFNFLQHKYPESSSEIDIEFDDITRKNKLVVNSGIIAVNFDEQSFFKTILAFTSGSNYKHYNKYTSQKVVNFSSTNKIHLKSDVIEGSVVNGFRQPILYTFVLNKPKCYKVICEPETIPFKKNKCVLNNITFHSENDNKEEVSFNGETLTFTLQLIKI